MLKHFTPVKPTAERGVEVERPFAPVRRGKRGSSEIKTLLRGRRGTKVGGGHHRALKFICVKRGALGGVTPAVGGVAKEGDMKTDRGLEQAKEARETTRRLKVIAFALGGENMGLTYLDRTRPLSHHKRPAERDEASRKKGISKITTIIRREIGG